MAIFSGRTCIWKFPLRIADVQTIRMPEGSRILTAQNQSGDVTVWAEVNPDSLKERRTFYIIGTGHPMPLNVVLEYVGSVQQPPYVWHVYIEPKEGK